MKAKEAGVIVGTLTRALADGSRDLATVPRLLVRIIDEELWRDREDPLSGRPYHCDTWEQFVTEPVPDGLGSSIKQLRGVCQENQEALNALARAERRQHGGDHRNKNDNITLAPTGTSAPYALHRLRMQRSDLHARVLAGELSPHAAMVAAGFRRPTLTIPREPAAAAKTLLRHFTPSEIVQLIELLEGGVG